MGELELIAAIEPALEDRGGRLVRWTGDDAAVTRARPIAVTSIDTLVDGVHFRRATHGLRDIGWEAPAPAGARPRGGGPRPGGGCGGGRPPRRPPGADRADPRDGGA